ncbi:hypothetical protein YTPLAS18_02310 [Nitrospira sp.]|nr:hypothetical protein YTPLAS18_02310 [Nitrospira sp.]
MGVGLVLGLGCAASPNVAGEAWGGGTILDVETRRPVSSSEWLASLGEADVIYIGEEHHNREHIKAALRILQSLVDQGRRPVLGMEMFSWDGQAALDRQVSRAPPSEDDFLDESKWKQNWGGAFDDYAPLVQFARAHGLRLRAWNAPRPLVRTIAKEGLARAMSSNDVRAWGMVENDIVDDDAYRTTIIGQLKACHGGGGDEEGYRRMYEASLFRDEAMAKTIADEYRANATAGVKNQNGSPIVSYTGSGHIQYGLPIPQRVSRRLGDGVKQVTVYLASFEPARTEEIAELMNGRVADFIWLTAIGAHGPPRRC